MVRALVLLSLIALAGTAAAQVPPAEPPSAAPPSAAPPSAAPPPAAPPATEPPPAPEPPPAEVPPAKRPLQPASWRLMLSDLTVLRLNPSGLETRARFGFQKRLFPSTKKIADNNFGFLGLFVKLNPVSANVGAGGELQPFSMLNVRAFAEVQQYTGTLGFLQSFASPNASYSDATLDDLADTARSAGAFHASIQPLLQARIGPFAIRALLQLDYWNLDLLPGITTAYEATFDTLLPDRGWTLSTDTDVLYTGRPGLAIGVRHSYVHPFYRREHFASDADEAAYGGDNSHQRIGLFAAYTLRDRGPSRFNKPTLILIASWYLSHRFRTGAPEMLPTGGSADDYTSRAFPYLLAGFAFESDFLAARY